MPAVKGIETGEKCPQCGKPLVTRYSKKTGNDFVGCSGYPECKYIKPGEGEAARPEPRSRRSIKCPTCGKPMLQRMGQRGPFLGCSGYPECKTTMNFDAEGKPVLASQADRARLREVRQADGDPRRAARAVPGLHRLSQVPQRQGRGRRGQPGQADRHGRQLREVRRADGGASAVPRARSWAAAPIRSAAAPSRCRRS